MWIDVLVVWEGSIEEVRMFMNEVSNIEQNIQFREEIGDTELNYLDLTIKINKENKWEFDVYRKKHILI